MKLYIVYDYMLHEAVQSILLHGTISMEAEHTLIIISIFQIQTMLRLFESFRKGIIKQRFTKTFKMGMSGT